MDIYKITNLITGKCYVGFSKDAARRFKRHISLATQGVNRRLYDSMRKHGFENFELLILDTCETKEEAQLLEKEWIKELNSLMPNGYNMTRGGDGGYTLGAWTDEERVALYRQQAESRIGTVVSDETRRKISEAHLGKTMPIEMRHHLSKIMKQIGHRPSSPQKGRPSNMKGKTHTDDARRKISEARMGKTWEDLWDDDYILERKRKLTMSFTAENNPRYVNFHALDKVNVLKFISENKEKRLSDIPDHVGYSEFKIRELLRDVGVENYQVAKKDHKDNWADYINSLIPFVFKEGDDVTEILNVRKWEPPAEFRAANAKGSFPHFIPKTDCERVQNLSHQVQQWVEDEVVFQKSEKLDGSSMTVFYKDGEVGCCSRNLELKDDGTSTFWETAKNEQLVEKLISLGKNIALQGELLGGQIQGNSYKITGFKFFLYDIYDIDKQEYLRPEVVEQFAAAHGISHVPIIGYVTLPKEDTIQALLSDADGKSAVGCNPKREGFVYKSTKDTDISVKCISNSWLLSNDG